MFPHTKKLLSSGLYLLLIILIALANWRWPFYLWLSDWALYRFLWLAIFFVLLDIFIEIILNCTKELMLIGENMAISREIHKLGNDFKLLSKVSLTNNLKSDFIVIGSSGVWLLNIKDDDGTVVFNGDDLVQNGEVLKGLMIKVLEKSFSFAEMIKKNINKDIRVAPVVVFSSPKIKLDCPSIIRGVYISSKKNIVSLIDNTDFQILDNKTIEEIYKIPKK